SSASAVASTRFWCRWPCCALLARWQIFWRRVSFGIEWSRINDSLSAFGSNAKNRQLLWPVRAEDEDALNVARAAGAGDEGNHARKIRRVFLLQAGKRGGQVGHKLFSPRDDDVMRRQHGQRASGRAAPRHHHAPRVGDERI